MLNAKGSILLAGLVLTAVTTAFAPLLLQDPEAFKITTPNASSSPTTRIKVSGNENTATIAMMDSNLGIGTATPGEKLDVNGAIKIGTASNTNNGTIRWTGTDFEGRKGGQWISFTAGGLDIGCRAKHGSDQSISHATTTVLALNSEDYDTDTMHDTATNNSRVTITTGGKYIVGASLMFASNSTGTRYVEIRHSSLGAIAINWFNANGGGAHEVTLTTEHSFAAGTYIEVFVYQTSGGSLNVLGGYNRSPILWARKVD